MSTAKIVLRQHTSLLFSESYWSFTTHRAWIVIKRVCLTFSFWPRSTSFSLNHLLHLIKPYVSTSEQLLGVISAGYKSCFIKMFFFRWNVYSMNYTFFKKNYSHKIIIFKLFVINKRMVIHVELSAFSVDDACPSVT